MQVDRERWIDPARARGSLVDHSAQGHPDRPLDPEVVKLLRYGLPIILFRAAELALGRQPRLDRQTNQPAVVAFREAWALYLGYLTDEEIEHDDSRVDKLLTTLPAMLSVHDDTQHVPVAPSARVIPPTVHGMFSGALGEHMRQVVIGESPIEKLNRMNDAISALRDGLARSLAEYVESPDDHRYEREFSEDPILLDYARGALMGIAGELGFHMDAGQEDLRRLSEERLDERLEVKAGKVSVHLTKPDGTSGAIVVDEHGKMILAALNRLRQRYVDAKRQMDMKWGDIAKRTNLQLLKEHTGRASGAQKRARSTLKAAGVVGYDGGTAPCKLLLSSEDVAKILAADPGRSVVVHMLTDEYYNSTYQVLTTRVSQPQRRIISSRWEST